MKKTIKNRLDLQAYRPPFQMYGMIWEFHNYDKDPFPSIPHGHSENRKYKLDVNTGDIYNVSTRQSIGKIGKKELKQLSEDKKFIKLKNEAIEFYNGLCSINKRNIVLRNHSSRIRYIIVEMQQSTRSKKCIPSHKKIKKENTIKPRAIKIKIDSYFN